MFFKINNRVYRNIPYRNEAGQHDGHGFFFDTHKKIRHQGIGREMAIINNTPSVQVKRVDYGNGLFATRRFDQDEVIGEVQGRIIDDPHYSSDYCIDFTETESLEPDEPFCYINHSCDPNSQLVCCEVYDDQGNVLEITLIVEATREISPDEQITIDYAWPADGAVPCYCGSRNCRGWIVAEEELDQLRRNCTYDMEFWAD